MVPDTFAQTKKDINETEGDHFPLSQLGNWITKEMTGRLLNKLKENGTDAAEIQKKSVAELYTEHEKQKNRLLRKILDPKGRSVSYSARKNYQHLCDLDKLYIYANWDWDQTVLDALHASGFSNFEEYDSLIGRTRAQAQPEQEPDKEPPAEAKEEKPEEKKPKRAAKAAS